MKLFRNPINSRNHKSVEILCGGMSVDDLRYTNMKKTGTEHVQSHTIAIVIKCYRKMIFPLTVRIFI